MTGLDATIHRCVHRWCNYVARWTNDDGKRWWCKDHAPGGSVYVMPPVVEEPVMELEGELIGTRLRVSVRYK